MKIRACVVDDEEPAIKELKLLLTEYTDIVVCGTAKTAHAAVELINEKVPDIVFLDIQLKEVNVFSVLEKINTQTHIIFVTAYNQFATRAFDINALDYLLKPIKPQRLKESIDRYKSNIRVAVEEPEGYKYSDRIIITEKNEYKLIKIEEIVSVCADGDYTIIYKSDGRKSMISRSMSKWEELLPNLYFERIHRGTIINLEYVDRIEKGLNNTCLVFMKGQKECYQMSQRATSKFLGKYKV